MANINDVQVANLQLFAAATRLKLRFASSRGDLSVEQLWDVPLRAVDAFPEGAPGGKEFNLDVIAKKANVALKAVREESFIETKKTPAQTRAEVALDVVKHIIEVKLAEEAAAKRRADNKLEKEKLLKILADKQAGQLGALSEKELQARIEALDV